MITGANSGIGKFVTMDLARTGGNVVMVCRNQAKGLATREEIKKKTGNEQLELMIADLSSLDSVRKLAMDYLATHDRLNILVNNAGTIIGKRNITSEGFEETFVTNYLSHFLLTNLLLDVLKKSAPSRIINVSSSAHHSGHMNFEDLQGEKRYSAMNSYSQSKLAQVLFTYELAERLAGTGVTVSAVHPGVVRSHWGDRAGILGIGIRIARPFMIAPEKGAQTPVYLATSKEVEGVSGKYFSSKKEKESSEESYRKDEAEKLWEVSLKLSGLSP